MTPLAMIVASLPSRKRSALPITNLRSGGKIDRHAARGRNGDRPGRRYSAAGIDRRFGVGGVGRGDNRHAGHRPHQGQIFDGLVRTAVLADGDAGVGGGNLHVQMG